MNLELVYRWLERVQHVTGATTTCATFDTPHGAVTLVHTDDGRRMYVNGDRVPLEELAQ